MSNTWPNGKRKALSQCEHSAWNANNYPGTLQLCCQCENPTGRCEEDQIYSDDGEIGPLCENCYHKSNDYLRSVPTATEIVEELNKE